MTDFEIMKQILFKKYNEKDIYIDDTKGAEYILMFFDYEEDGSGYACCFVFDPQGNFLEISY